MEILVSDAVVRVDGKPEIIGGPTKPADLHFAKSQAEREIRQSCGWLMLWAAIGCLAAAYWLFSVILDGLR